MSAIQSCSIVTTYRIKPILQYRGLTIVMSNPSRFDKVDLLSGNGGYFFLRECLSPEFNRMQCDIRLKDNKEPLLPNTKCVLVLGETAMREWFNNKINSLGELRGSPEIINGIPHICSYLPQDTQDYVDFEGKFNPYVAQAEIADLRDSEVLDEKRRHGRTSRKNWAFWLQQDVRKCKEILKYGSIPKRPFEPEYILYPNERDVVKTLLEHKQDYLYLDLETDADSNITVFSFAFPNCPIHIVPVLLWNYTKAYNKLSNIFAALAVAIRDNTTVSHYGSGFDFFILALKYRIPIGESVYDTLLAHHRCYPGIERSLGHCTSLWTYEPYHKDEGNFAYSNQFQAESLWRYCGKDVYTMMLIHHTIEQYARKVPGLQASIDQVNASIRPYLTTSLLGIKYEISALEAVMKENDRLMMQYLRCIHILIGENTTRAFRRMSKKAMPGSNVQCCKYFHEMLDYPIIARSPKTGKPSLAKETLYKLRLRHENPVIDFCLAFRRLAKESGSLKFIPWKCDNDDTTNNTKECSNPSQSS